MRLTNSEFWGMNTGIHRFFQRQLEFPVFRWLGLSGQYQDILEIGCGSGYSATLLSQLQPRSYVGIDVMPEMIELAKQWDLPNAVFLVMNASDLSHFADANQDSVVIFGILHHISAWREVPDECHRVLRHDGKRFQRFSRCLPKENENERKKASFCPINSPGSRSSLGNRWDMVGDQHGQRPSHLRG